MNANRAELEQLLAEKKIRNKSYQRIELPGGLATVGKDRSPTADIVMPESLDSRSVLDVGCAIGFFCFEAERRGATRVLGTDLDPERLRQATLLKSAFESGVDFELRDILREPADERFDLVLALNVIHHVDDPFAAIESLAGLTRWRLAIEFPTFGAPKYRQRNRMSAWWLYNRGPLVGLLDTTEPRGSKFVFAPAAIEHVIKHRSKPLFRTIRFEPSPMRGRMIAICEKK